MSPFIRGIKYITRKRGKTVILFLLLLVISTLAMSGIAVRSAVETAQLNVRQALGGVFTMAQNTSDPSKWESSAVGEYGYKSWYTGAQLTEELAERVKGEIKGIKGCNLSAVNYVIVLNSGGKVLTLPESEDESGMGSLMSGFGDFNSTVAAYANTDTAYSSYFAGGYLELAEGRHITSKDSASVLISKELAELNGLKTGDRLTLQVSEYMASMKGIDPKTTQAEVEIAGLFTETVKSTSTLPNWSIGNSLFTTMNIVAKVRPDTLNEGYEQAHFYVEDPALLEDIAEQVKGLSFIDPTDFVISCDTETLDSVAKPLENIDTLLTALIRAVLIVGAVVLYLILAARIKERTHESGVLLSLGFSKGNILAQYITEALLIAVLAISLSVPVSGAFSEAVASRLIDSNAAQNEQDSSQPFNSFDGISVVDSSDFAAKFESRTDLTEIKVTVEPAEVGTLYAAGIFITVLSVAAAALPVLKTKPREILSKMS